MLTSRSCSWCHRMNPVTTQVCEGCGHHAHASRLDCRCGRCVLGRRHAATVPAPVPLTDEIARLVATLRLGAGGTECPAALPITRSEKGAMRADDEPETTPATAETRRMPVGSELVEAIRRMDDLLQAEFGFDLAYCILARGLIVAASNSRDGYIPPTVAAEVAADGN